MRKSVSSWPGDEGRCSANTTQVFGVSLEEVTRTHTISGHEVPALVKHIVDYIEEHGHLDMEELFLVNGNAERVDWLRQRYDSGEEVELEKEADLASAVSLLRLFLQELPEPVIPAAIQGHILQLHQDYSNEEELFRNLKYLLQQLPQLNYGLLRFLCRFLASVASLQQESWNVGTLAAVFGPDIFHLSTDGEDLRDQESVSRVLAELLDNQEGLFDSEDEELSTTNDYSSINEQITELLDDDKCEAECEELPQDGEEGPASTDSPPHTKAEDHLASSSHLSPISILPADSTQLIHQSFRAAVEHHLLELKTTIDQDLSSYTSQGVRPSDPEACGCHVDKDQQTETEDLSFDLGDGETQQKEIVQSQNDEQDSEATTEEGSGMDLDQNSINSARQDNQTCDIMEGADTGCCELDTCQCDQNANTSENNRNLLSPCQPNTGASPHLQLFPDNQWEDPVPAYKSWHDDSESGEAQLSPLAGRMVPLPPLLLVEEEEEEEGEEGERGQDASPSLSRSHPHFLARRFLDFGAHSAQRFLQQDPDTTSPTKGHSRPRRASFGSKEAMRGDSVTHQLTKKLQHLKKKIKQFEEQFEKERNYKPSHGDKAANPKVLKWMTDLTKIRRQIKDAKQRAESELGPQTRPRSNTLPKSFGSTLDHGALSAPEEAKGPHPTREETLELIQCRVKGKREEDCWPEDIKKMTKEQLSCEKTVLQKNLLHYEDLHGRPCSVCPLLAAEEYRNLMTPSIWFSWRCKGLFFQDRQRLKVTREERLVMKPLYDRYRLVKQMLTRVSITPVTVSPSSKRRSQTLQPIIEGETAHFWEEIKEEEEEEQRGGVVEEEEEEREEDEEEEEGESSGGEMQSPDIIMAMDPMSQGRQERYSDKSQTRGLIRGKLEEGSGKLAMDLRLSSSNASSMPELLEQLWKARAEKKQLRKTIREFEEHFYQHNGRHVQKEDRLPMMEEYREYKRIKAKLRLLEVLISKQDTSKSI